MAKSRRRRFVPLELPPGLWQSLQRVAEEAGLSPRGGQPLADAVRSASALYTGERGDIPHRAQEPDILAARLLFFLVRDFSKCLPPLAELWQQGLRPAGQRLRVLDLGAGVGASALGVARFARQQDLAGVDLTAFDQSSAALGVARRLLEALGEAQGFLAPVALSTQTGSALRASDLPEGPFDLVIASFVLNELLLPLAEQERAEHGASMLGQWFSRVAPGGALLVLEPALKGESRTLSAVRDVLVRGGDAPHVVAPCLHAGPCPMLATERDWCHQVLPLALPEPWAGIARAAGLRYEGLSYSYLSLRHVPRAQERALGEGVRALRVVSDVLVTKGKRELFGCGDGELVRLTLLDRDASDANADFDELARGDVFELSGAAAKGPGLRVVADTRVRRRN